MSISSTETNISCYGLLDGSVQIDVFSGGLPPFEYSDNNGQSFQNSNIFNGLSHRKFYIYRERCKWMHKLNLKFLLQNQMS